VVGINQNPLKNILCLHTNSPAAYMPCCASAASASSGGTLDAKLAGLRHQSRLQSIILLMSTMLTKITAVPKAALAGHLF
jgi:hypothetical protein